MIKRLNKQKELEERNLHLVNPDNQLTDVDIKNVELKLLKEFHNICSQNSFRYSLAGGSLLGAIRHAGFIPWDDDIDILMLRSDYNAFVDYCHNNNTPFQLLDNKYNKQYGQGNAKICDESTFLIEDTGIRGDYDEGVYLDVFPIDSLEDTYEESLKVFKSTRLLLELLVAANWEKYAKSKTRDNWWIEPIRLILFLATRLLKPNAIANKIERIIAARKINTKFCGCYYGSYREKEVLPREIYEQVELIKFEDSEFYCLTAYDKYLCCLYGDYMKLPPVNKQVSHHGFVAYWKGKN